MNSYRSLYQKMEYMQIRDRCRLNLPRLFFSFPLQRCEEISTLLFVLIQTQQCDVNGQRTTTLTFTNYKGQLLQIL